MYVQVPPYNTLTTSDRNSCQKVDPQYLVVAGAYTDAYMYVCMYVHMWWSLEYGVRIQLREKEGTFRCKVSYFGRYFLNTFYTEL